jgi:hypothetical protein
MAQESLADGGRDAEKKGGNQQAGNRRSSRFVSPQEFALDRLG